MNCSSPNNCSRGCCPNNPFASLLAEIGLICSAQLQEIYRLFLEEVPQPAQQDQLARCFNIFGESSPPHPKMAFEYGQAYMFVRLLLEDGDPQILDELRTSSGWRLEMTLWSIHRLFRERAIKYGRINL